jgi:hypothetical protein
VKKLENTVNIWTVCPECKGQGKKSRRISKKVRLHYQMAVEQFEKSNGEGTAPIRPKTLGFLLELFRFWISCCYKPSIPDSKIIHMWLLLVAV